MRIGTLLGIVAGVAACAESASPVAPSMMDQPPALSAEVSSTQLTRAFRATRWIACANGGQGESVTLLGELEIRSHMTEDGNGGSHMWSFVRPSGVVGIGTSGRTYRGTGGTFEGEGYASDGDPSVYTFVNNFRIIGQGPGNNLLVHMVIHQTFNANGELTADVDFSSNECR